jgi:hypothetical protein
MFTITRYPSSALPIRRCDRKCSKIQLNSDIDSRYSATFHEILSTGIPYYKVFRYIATSDIRPQTAVKNSGAVYRGLTVMSYLRTAELNTGFSLHGYVRYNFGQKNVTQQTEHASSL